MSCVAPPVLASAECLDSSSAGLLAGKREMAGGRAWVRVGERTCGRARRAGERTSGREGKRMGGRGVKSWDVRKGLKDRVRVGGACARGKDWREREKDGTRDDVPATSSSVPTQVCPPSAFLVLFHCHQLNLILFVDVQTAAMFYASWASARTEALIERDAADIVEGIWRREARPSTLEV